MIKFKYGIDFGNPNAKRLWDADLKLITLALFNWFIIGVSQDFRVFHFGLIDIIRRY